eukprot:m.133954 g.133954  ORF g.133954 m.133954 type:complete len:309 (-) comp22509_c0_seq2:1005-1931(-)
MDVCDQGGKPTTVDIHPTEAELAIVGSVQCPICRKQMRNKGVLNVHLKSHGSQLNRVKVKGEVARYFCPVLTCTKHSLASYRRLSQLKEHYANTHATKTHGCGRCGKFFGLESSCKRHQARCGVRLQCGCGKEFTSREGLSKHIKKSGHVVAVSVPQIAELTPHLCPTTTSSSTSTATAAPSLEALLGDFPDCMGVAQAAALPIGCQPSTMVEVGAQTLMVGDEFEAGTALVALTPLSIPIPMPAERSGSQAAAACQTPFEWTFDPIEDPLPFGAEFGESWAQTDFTFSINPFSESATQTQMTNPLPD